MSLCCWDHGVTRRTEALRPGVILSKGFAVVLVELSPLARTYIDRTSPIGSRVPCQSPRSHGPFFVGFTRQVCVFSITRVLSLHAIWATTTRLPRRSFVPSRKTQHAPRQK
jgi:hypothetical protein